MQHEAISLDKNTSTEVDNSEALNNLDAFAAEEGATAKESAKKDESLIDEVSTSDANEMAAQQGAALAVGFIETLVKAKWGFVQVDKQIREQVTEKTIPVMRKYGGGLPDWLQPYKEEIELGMTLAVAGFGIYSQVQMYKQSVTQFQQSDTQSSQSDTQAWESVTQPGAANNAV